MKYNERKNKIFTILQNSDLRLLEKLYRVSLDRIYRIRETKYIQEEEKGGSEFREFEKLELK